MVLLISLLLFTLGNTCVTGDVDKPEVQTSTLGEEDLIDYLPGLVLQPSFKQYSGYLRGSSDNVQLHYWFVEALQNPEEKPLILWLNGGPGCSSLEGLLSENGPFTVKEHGSLIYNLYSWNRLANVLYLESPGGVGYSYVKNGNVTTGDDETSLNNFNAVVHFLEKFPQYKGRDFYIAGESYGGVYVPLLTLRFIENNFTDLNLKGIAVGNGFLNERFNENSLLYFTYYHGLADESMWNDLMANCCADKCASKCMFSDNKSTQCMNVIAYLSSATEGLDVYNLYAPCEGGVRQFSRNPQVSSKHHGRLIPEKDFLFRDNYFIQLKRNQTVNSELHGKFIISCVDDTNKLVYLNDLKVRRALHVDFEGAPVWDTCNAAVNTNYRRTYKALQPQYMEILKNKIPVLLYAGDVDTACNYLGILWFVDDLGLKMRQPLTHWLYIDSDGTKQVGGIQKTVLLGETPLTFATVRGSGHMVPEDKPIPAYHLISTFIQGKSL